MKRLFLVVGVAIALVVVVAVLFVYSSLESVVKTAIEKVGSDITKTEVRLDDVDISMRSGSGSLRGFRVANPDGFEDDDVFRFDEVTMVIDLETLAQDPVVIKEIVFEGARINYHLGTRGSNVDEVQDNVEEYGGPTDGGGPNLVIEHLHFRNGEISVTGPKLLGSKKITTPLPDLHLQNIGGDEGGATPAQVARKLMSGIGRKVTTAVGKLDLDPVKEGVPEEAEAAVDAAQDAGKKLKKLFEKEGE